MPVLVLDVHVASDQIVEGFGSAVVNQGNLQVAPPLPVAVSHALGC